MVVDMADCGGQLPRRQAAPWKSFALPPSPYYLDFLYARAIWIRVGAMSHENSVI